MTPFPFCSKYLLSLLGRILNCAWGLNHQKYFFSKRLKMFCFNFPTYLCNLSLEHTIFQYQWCGTSILDCFQNMLKFGRREILTLKYSMGVNQATRVKC